MKTCSKCEADKDELDFNWKSKPKGIRHSICKDCLVEARSIEYQKNKSYYILKAVKNKKKTVKQNRLLLIQFLQTHPCVDCGMPNPVVLQFDHVRGKKSGNISKMLIRGCSWGTIQKEMSKCEIRCANCHFIKTASRNDWWSTNFQCDVGSSPIGDTTLRYNPACRKSLQKSG